LGETTMFDPTKRHTLETLLAAISVALVKPQDLLQAESWKPLLTSTIDLAMVNTETMQGLQSLIEACWQLSRGNELALAEKLLPVYMAKVVPLAQQPSPYQWQAIDLAAQGFHLSGLLAWHHNNMQARELYYTQTVQYSRLSENPSLLIPALRSLGNTYYHKGQYPQALRIYQDALLHTENASPLLQACVYISLAVAYAHIGQHQDALTYLGLAHDTFPDHPETDPSFFYAEFDLSQMILWEGIMCTQLGQSQQALDILSRVDRPDFVASERLRIQIINQQAKTAIFANDLEQGAAYVKTGLMAAKALGSQRRYSEAYENFQQMRLLWPQEQRMMELGELLH
jgi:tetratricopeptide (TPR) repeat protein